MDKLATNAEVAALDIALFRQSLSNISSDMDRDSEGNTVDQASSQYTDHRTLCIDQWTTRKARVRDSIRTDIAFEGNATPCAKWAADCANDADACHWSIAWST